MLIVLIQLIKARYYPSALGFRLLVFGFLLYLVASLPRCLYAYMPFVITFANKNT